MIEKGPDGASAPSGPFFVGIETEYGFTVEGRGADDQIEDAIAFVRGYPGPCFVGWDYRPESPRADLRGFQLDRLSFDPEDAKHDEGRVYAAPHEVRSDRVLPNGARFYNDHGHPEYATPECATLEELVLHDKAGEFVLLRAAQALSESTGSEVKVYKNNTDFHGSSYGTHENFLAPRALGFDRLFPAIAPMLVARQILTGAGKVGVQSGSHVDFQLSSRADFFTEAASADTLYRRPVFNTRDEPHADPAQWIRLHVISGDANMIPGCTRRKVGLVKLALLLEIAGNAPKWELDNPVRAFQAISRDDRRAYRVELRHRSWTTAYEILESYFAAAESTLNLDQEMIALIAECRMLLNDLAGSAVLAPKHIDWAAKRAMLDSYVADSGGGWRDPALQAFDLEYHNIDPAEGLYFALEEMGEVEAYPPLNARMARLDATLEPTRAKARGIAVSRFGQHLVQACWRSLVLNLDDNEVSVELTPSGRYGPELDSVADVGTFIQLLRNP